MPNPQKIMINYYLNRAVQILGPIQNVTVTYDQHQEPKISFTAQHIQYQVNRLPADPGNGFRIQATKQHQTVISYRLVYIDGLKEAKNELQHILAV